MGQNAQPDRQKRSWITVDWLVFVIAAIALFLLVGTMVRKTIDVHPALSGSGYQMLGAQDQLIAFETFSFAPEEWSISTTADDLPGLGPVLGPFGDDPVQRGFTLPTGAAAASLRFDLTLLGTWGVEDVLSIALDERQVAELSVDAQSTLTVARPDVAGVTVQSSHRSLTPSAPDTSLGAEVSAITIVRIQMLLENPSDTLTLRLQGAGDGLGAGEATWALDTLSMSTALGDQITP